MYEFKSIIGIMEEIYAENQMGGVIVAGGTKFNKYWFDELTDTNKEFVEPALKKENPQQNYLKLRKGKYGSK